MLSFFIDIKIKKLELLWNRIFLHKILILIKYENVDLILYET